MRVTTRHIAVLAVFLAGSVLASCSGDDESAKAGGSDGPVTLRIGTDDSPGKPAADQIEEFARRVEALSDGKLRIKPVWHAAGDGPDWDQRVARMITSGKLDMSLTPSRAWDTEGVTSLRALNAPFLVTSDELLDEVISGELADELMSGLDQAGVVGLALFPEDLRHPFGLKKPLLGPDDYAGRTIRAPASKTASAVFAALGATTNDEEADASIHAGLESGYLQDVPGTVTGNVTFYPKVNALVVNEDVFEDLDEDQVDILEQAASQTRDWAIETTPTDAEAAKDHCDAGSRIVLASQAEVAALERAVQPVTAGLERDEQTKQLIEAIRDLQPNGAVSATAAKACGTSQASDSASGSGADDSALNGVYRFEITDAQLRQSGATSADSIANHHGVITYTLKDGAACWEQKGPNPEANGEGCDRYEIDGARLIIRYPAGEPDVFRWKKTANGDLKLTFVSAQPGEDGEGVARATAIPTWKRIGDAE